MLHGMQFSTKTFFSDCPDAELVFDEQFVHEVLREVVYNLSGTTLQKPRRIWILIINE